MTTSRLPSKSPPAAAPPAWSGLDPSQLEPRGRGGMFVMAFVLYLVLAVAVVWWLARPGDNNNNNNNNGNDNGRAGAEPGLGETVRGAPIDAGPGSQPAEMPAAAETARDGTTDDRDSEPERLDGRYAPLDFDLLTSFYVPDPWEPPRTPAATGRRGNSGRPEVPEYIRRLDGEPVALIGFASTHNLGRDGRAREFVLYRTQAQCCFGALPLPHEVVLCRVEGGGGLDLVDGVPMRIKGVLQVTPEYERDTLLGVYRMRAEAAELVGW